MRFSGSGLVAIVGPNGCGKSNVSDAISWVLGEQSAKNLRGSRMMDVIFAGTRERKPVSMASVSLALVDPAYSEPAPATGGNGDGVADDNGHGPPKPREITITRRLFRSGDSEYLIDGRLARLRDIQDLFMGTGLGPQSYAIIEQGRIGQILSSKPQDRRAIIEEAAGVSKFKSRKRLAEAKLEGARQNLSRVFDILEEVGRQVNSLKRQASKARRYQALHADMIVQLRRTLAGRFRLLEREAAKTALDLKLATTEYQDVASQVAGKENEQAVIQEQCYSTEGALTETRGKLSELRLEAERTRGRTESQASHIADIEQRLAQGETESQALGTRSAELGQQVEAHGRTLAELVEQAEQARRALAAKIEERESVHRALRQREQEIETARQSVLRLLGEASALNNELAQIDEYLASIDRETARAEKEQHSAVEELERLAAVSKEMSEKLAVQHAELASVTGQRRKVEEELSARKARVGEARQRLEQLRSETSAIKARKDSLAEILSHRAYTTESVKRLFTAIEQGQERELEPLGVLADFIDVDPAYEKAAEEFLHDELEYVVVKDWSQADKGIELMRRDLNGRATFLVHPEPEASFAALVSEPPLGPETGIRSRLSSTLRMTNGLTHAPTELLPRLARCMIAEDRTAAQRLAQQYPDFYFLLPDGVCYHGYAVSGGKQSAIGPLALKREFRELTTLLQSRERELSEASSLVETLDAEIASFEEQLEGLRASQQGREKEVLALEHEIRKLDEGVSRTSSRLSVARAELERLEGEKDRARQQREQNQRSVEEKEQARQTHERELEEARQHLEQLQAELARLSEEHSALRVELAEREERRRSERTAQERLEAQSIELTARRNEITSEMERLGVERARLLASNIELGNHAQTLAEDVARTEEQVKELEAREAGLRQDLAAMEEILKQLRNNVQAGQEKRSQIEVAMAERRAELRYLDETSQKELDSTLQELAQAEQEELDEVGLAEAEEKYSQLTARINALGSVNPQALEEFQEAQQRFDFLNAQRQDLLDSIRDTETAIHDIDTETRKRFSRAFEVINGHFREMFKVLFGGGTGEMRLTDETNLAESGVDIVASPPGKRLQNVLLLSGGEKALTALALLMAIFHYQPSPFCILDEVDAPLDEANIQRLLRLLKKMARQTQFIVITHAKSTMEAAETLYGVTMQEPGVSRLVSVKFQPLPETAPAPQPQAMAVRAD